jgi:hypothetical protein
MISHVPYVEIMREPHKKMEVTLCIPECLTVQRNILCSLMQNYMYHFKVLHQISQRMDVSHFDLHSLIVKQQKHDR